MNKPKSKKAGPAPKRNASRLRQPQREAPSSQTSNSNAWGEEVRALQGRRFETLEDAIAGLADLVLAKMGSDAAQRESERRYLIDLLRTDEQICEILRSSLRIG